MATFKCLICGKPYEGCSECTVYHTIEDNDFDFQSYCKSNGISEDEMKEIASGWKGSCDSIKHFLVYDVVRKINYKKITSDEAKSRLIALGYDTKNLNEFIPSVRELLKNEVFKRSSKKEVEQQDFIPTRRRRG